MDKGIFIYILLKENLLMKSNNSIDNVAEEATETYMSKEEILKCFEGKGQTEIPFKGELRERQIRKGLPLTRDGIVRPIEKKPSRTYLSNLNPRILKADRLWKKLWMHERGSLLKSIGITDTELIQQLANSNKTPDMVIDYFIMNKNQPKEFHRTQQESSPSMEIVLYKGETSVI